MATAELPPPSAPAAKKVDYISRTAFFEVLKPEGFKRAANVFRRALPDVPSMQVLNLQSSSGNLGSSGTFCVNLGVYFPVLAQLTAPLKRFWVAPFDKALPHHGQIQCRIHSLLPETREDWWLPEMERNRDLWFDVGPERDLEQLAEVVRRVLRSYVVPWLKRNGSPEALALDNTAELFHRLAAFVALGKKDGARELYAAEKHRIRFKPDEIDRWFSAMLA